MKDTSVKNRCTIKRWLSRLMMLLFCTAVSVGNSVAQTYQKGSAGNPFQYTRASLTERVKVVMIGASSIQPNTGVGCAGVDQPNNDYKGKVSYTTKTGGFTTNSAQGYSSADVTQNYFADYPFSCPSIAHAYLYWGGSAYADMSAAPSRPNLPQARNAAGTASATRAARRGGGE